MSSPNGRRPSASSGNAVPNQSLALLCRKVIVSNLERYPPESFSILDEFEFETLIKLRHDKTRPQRGKGGLDGTGRITPAVNERFILEIEHAIPHLARLAKVDTLVWKDMVNHKFRIGGLSRPKGLLFPWPVLESRAKQAGNVLRDLSKTDDLDEETKKSGLKAIKIICDLPMDVSLLKSSEIGKVVKKFLKACSSKQCLSCFNECIFPHNLQETPRSKLELVLESWMTMAAKSGVKMKDAVSDSSTTNDCGQDLAVARTCKSWRELYHTLKEFDEMRRSNQGARMRERRQMLDSVRPKIVKVRHASSRQNNILNRQHLRIGSSQSSPSKSKISQLRSEARVISKRFYPTQSIERIASASAKPARGFGTAVAYATGGKKRKSSTTMIDLKGGKRMKVPDSKKLGTNIKQRLLRKGGPTSRR